VAVSLLLVMVACGRKGPPLPPQIRVADTTRDLEVYQEGREAVLTWSYPDITTAGGPLPDVEAVEVWRATIPAGQEPPDVTSRDRELRYRLLESEGELLVALDREGLDDATRGSKLRFRDDLELWHEAYPEGERWIVWYSVRTICCRKRESEFSNIVRLSPQLPPSAPEGLKAWPRDDGITLTWRPREGLDVLVERSQDGASWRAVTAASVTGDRWLDATVEQDEQWRYRLRSVRVVNGVRVVGDPGEVVEVDYPDVYPPIVPANLVCLPEEARVRVRWQAIDDAVWHRVSRRLNDGQWEVLAAQHRGVVFEDSNPPLGTLTYAVRAIDQADNVSEPATCTTMMGVAP
jgi:predicted small lipoprotein YifL